MKFVSKKKAGAVLVAVLIMGGAAVAFAYWTQGGSGTGTADTGTTVDITVNQTSAITGLYPGGSAVTLSGNFTNGNSGPVQVGSVTAVVDPTWSVQTDGAKPACAAADFTIGGSAVVNASVSPGTGGSWTGLTIQLANAGTNQDNCKSVTVDLLYTASAAA